MSTVMRWNWNDLRYFLAVVDADGVSAAARLLGVEHTTVARRIEALETALGLRLFDRLPHAWKLTAEGEHLTESARRAELGLLAFDQAASGQSGHVGKVIVSAPPFLLSHLLIPRMGARLRALSGVELEFLGEVRSANLPRKEADIALRLARPTEPSVAGRALATLGFGLYGTQAYLAATPPAQWEFIGYDASLSHTPQQRWLESLVDGRRCLLRCNELVALFQAVRSGIGVAALPHYAAYLAPELQQAVDEQCPEKRTLWLAMHEDVRRSPRVRAVADAIADVLQGVI